MSLSDVHNVEPVRVCQVMSQSDMLCFCQVGPNVTVRHAVFLTADRGCL